MDERAESKLRGHLANLQAELELHEHLTSLAGPLRWYIARTQGGQDGIAKEALRIRGYTVYRPIMPLETRRNHGRPRVETRSMFPGYFFVLPANSSRRTDIGPWEMLRTAPGMIYGDGALLKRNGYAATIAHNDPIYGGIVQIREAEERLSIPMDSIDGLPYKLGERVHVKKGPFIEMLGVIETLDDNQRIGLLIDIFGRPTRVSVSPAHIISAEA